jgi:hypothetical protein
LRLPAAATSEQIAWAVRRLTIPLDSEPLYDCRASATVSQVKVNRVYILRHISGRETDDWKCGRLHLFLVGCDEFLHRTSVVDGNDERNNRDEDRRSSDDEIEPRKPGVVGV